MSDLVERARRDAVEAARARHEAIQIMKGPNYQGPQAESMLVWKLADRIETLEALLEDKIETDAIALASSEVVAVAAKIEALEAEVKTKFHAGARAMFNYFAMYVANHDYGEETLVMELAESALEDVSPESHDMWKKIGELAADNKRLREREILLCRIAEKAALARKTEGE